jgi:hypothetical protein
MSGLPFICAAALAGVCAASLFVTVVRAEDQTTDIGTLDKEMAEKTFPAKPPYSPYAGRNFPKLISSRIVAPNARRWSRRLSRLKQRSDLIVGQIRPDCSRPTDGPNGIVLPPPVSNLRPPRSTLSGGLPFRIRFAA